MLATIQGTVRGRHIELARETGLPAGSTVIVDIRSAPLTLTEKRRRVDELCGVWAGDADVNAVFSEIEQERSITLPREAKQLHPHLPSTGRGMPAGQFPLPPRR